MNEFNSHGKWRLELAKEISQRVQKIEGIQAIVIGGSVAQGYADQFSDLEMPLFWDTLPTDSVRKAIVSDLQAEFLYEYNGPAGEDNLLIQGFQVDFWHNTVSHEEMIIVEVLERFDTDLGNSNFMDTVRACIPLYGEAIINRWKEKAQHYPDELVIKNIRENIGYLKDGHLEIHAKRENPTMVYGLISELQKRIFLVLLALNRLYFPTFKWIYQSLETMWIKPINVEQRFRRAYNCFQDEAIKDLFEIIHETLFLVNQHYPQIDTVSVSKRLSLSRKAYNTPVSL